jgi:hypothetical protein
MLDRFLKFCFILSFLFLVFLIGFFSHKYKFNYLYTNINYGIGIIESYLDINLYDKIGDREQRQKLDNSKIILNNNFDFYNKPSSKFDYYLLIKHDHSQPTLMSSPDKVEWSWDLSIFRNNTKIVPLHLFSNGNLIVGNYENKGIYKIDKYGKLIWKINYISHHWIDIYNESLFIPSRKFVNLPKESKKNNLKNTNLNKCNVDNSMFDTILIIDSKTGLLKKELDLMKSLSKDRRFIDILNENYEKDISLCKDPLHLNDVRVIDNQIKENLQKSIPDINEGDLILSFRSLNLILFYDYKNKKIKNIIYNLFEKQHSPRIDEYGNLYVFDNRPQEKKSKIVKIDILNHNILSYYEDIRFKSDVKGRIQFLEGNLFVQSSAQGEIFQIICKDGFFEECLSKYLYSSNFSFFYPSKYFDSSLTFKKDSLFLADFYKKDYVKFLE